MTIHFETRPSDSPYLETVTQGYTAGSGSAIRPAECQWHLVFTRHQGVVKTYVVGPWISSGMVHYPDGAEMLWLRFKLGTYMPHLPTRKIIDSETLLPPAAHQAFWLKSAAWEMPTFENADTFIEKLVRDDLLTHDPVVQAVLEGQPTPASPRTVRHRFLHSTGVTYKHICQAQRAHHAMTLLQGGMSILDTVFEAGYFDQPHLTRSLKQFIGYTPAQQRALSCQPD